MRVAPDKWQVLLPVPVEEIGAGSVRRTNVFPATVHGLAVTTPREIARRRREAPARGLPTHIALSEGGYWVFLYPTPPEEYDLTITEYATVLPRG